MGGIRNVLAELAPAQKNEHHMYSLMLRFWIVIHMCSVAVNVCEGQEAKKEKITGLWVGLELGYECRRETLGAGLFEQCESEMGERSK